MVDTTTHEEKKKKKGRGGLESNINKRLGRIRARRRGGGRGEGGSGENFLATNEEVLSPVHRPGAFNEKSGRKDGDRCRIVKKEPSRV